MAKNYRNKEETLAEARRLGITGAEYMSWPELQSVVSKELKREELGMVEHPGANKMKKRMTKERNEYEMMKPYLGKTIMLSPELSAERYRLVKYDEVLGNEVEVEERRFDMDRDTDKVFDVSGEKVSYDNIVDEYHDYTTGTFRIKNRSDRKVVAMSSVPKENAGMFYRPGYDMATVVTWNGRAGYLWKHWRYPNVKALLIASGYYQEYKDRFKDEPNVWYAAGKQLVCDPNLVHQIFAEIEEKERKRRAEESARLRSMGIDPEDYKW